MSATHRRLLQPWWLLVLIASFVTQLVSANVRVAWDILTPRPILRPAVLRVLAHPRLDDVGLVLLANLISVTPGTLTLEVDPSQRVLYVHVMYPESTRGATSDQLDRLQSKLVAALYAHDPATGTTTEGRR